MKKIIAFSVIFLFLFFIACANPAEPADAKATASTPNQGVTADELYTRLKEAGLPVDYKQVRSDEEDDLLGRPNQYISRVDFADMCTKHDFVSWIGGSIYLFNTEQDAQARLDYLNSLAQSGLGADYNYIDGKVLLSIDGDVRPSEAARYEAVFYGQEAPEEQPGKIVQFKIPLDRMFFTDEEIATIKSSPEPSERWKSLGVAQRYVDGETYVIEVPQNRKDGFIAAEYNSNVIAVMKLKNGKNTPYVTDIDPLWDDDITFVTIQKDKYTRDEMIVLACGISIKQTYYYALLGAPDREHNVDIYDENENLLMTVEFQNMDYDVTDYT